MAHASPSRRLAVLSAALTVLTLGAGSAQAECGQWLREVALPKIGCSPQSIAQICAGQRSMPTNGSCPDLPVSAPGAGSAGTSYQNFQSLAAGSGINVNAHPTYTEQYVDERTQGFCALLRDGNMTKLMGEVSFPPVVHWGETTQDRSRLEVAILMTGIPARCPEQEQQMRAFVGSIMR